MPTPSRHLAAAAVAVVVLLVVACGSDVATNDSDIAALATTAPIETDTQTPSATSAPAQQPTTALTVAPRTTTFPISLVSETAASLNAVQNLTVEIEGQMITLQDGRAEQSYGGASTDVYELRSDVAQGDINGDGTDDLVAHLTLRTAGSGTFHYLIPILVSPTRLVAQPAVFIGDRIVLDDIRIGADEITATTLDRGTDDPFTIVSEVVTYQIRVRDGASTVLEQSREPLEQYLLPSDPLAAFEVTFEPGTTQAVLAGAISYGQRQPYLLDVEQGQEFNIELRGPLGLIVHVRQGDVELHDQTKPDQVVTGSFPTSGEWIVEVVSANVNDSDFELTIEVSADPPGGQNAGQQPGATPAPTAEFTESTTPPVASTPTSIPAAPGSPGTIHLTFDDGPNSQYTPQILDVLSRYQAKATFFVLGTEAQARPELLEQIVSEGHTLANHTNNHDNLAGMTQAQFNDTVEGTQRLLGARASNCLRPPYGSTDAFTAQYAADIGLRLMLWTVDTNDWKQPGTDSIAQRVIAGASDGAVVLMHDGGGNRAQTVTALDQALAVLTARGWTFTPAC